MSFNIEYTEFLAKQQELRELGMSFSVGGYSWGFPFKMYWNRWGFPSNVGFELLPTVINLILAIALAGVLGIAFQFVSDRFRSTSAK